jgi:hypothetical protein
MDKFLYGAIFGVVLTTLCMVIQAAFELGMVS